MKPTLQWLKNNPILIAAAVLCIAALGMLMVVHFQGREFRRTMGAHRSTISAIDELRNTPVEMPSEHVDGKPTTHHRVMNEATRLAVGKVYGVMTEQYERIRDVAVNLNQDANRGHYPMVEGLFPDPGEEKEKLYDARERYKEAFAEFLKKYSERSTYPTLNAGPALDLSMLGEVEFQAQQEFLHRGLVPQVLADLTEKELEELAQLTMQRKIQHLERAAQRIHIYVSADSLPFELSGWCYQDQLPTLGQVWEGQMGLWLQQDIV